MLLLLSFLLGRNRYWSFIAVRKALGYKASVFVWSVDGGGNSICRLLKSPNLEGSANLSCHLYFSLTNGYFSHS